MRLIIGVAFELLVILFKTKSPILWGIGGGLVGALLGAGAGLLSEMALQHIYPIELWPAMAILLGYPIGTCCGITLANQKHFGAPYWALFLVRRSGWHSGILLTEMNLSALRNGSHSSRWWLRPS